MITVKEVLERALEILSRPHAWTKGANRKWISRAPDGVCYCASGAIVEAARQLGGEPYQAQNTIREQIRKSRRGNQIETWNDSPKRKKSEVLAMFRRTIKALS